MSRIIAVDFDGCVCEKNWPDIGAPIWPVIHALQRRQAEGDRLILWTCRCDEKLTDAVAWSLNHGLRFDAVNENVPERVEMYGNDSRKVSADEYWDDRNVTLCALGGEWAAVTQGRGHCVTVEPLLGGKKAVAVRSKVKRGLFARIAEKVRAWA